MKRVKASEFICAAIKKGPLTISLAFIDDNLRGDVAAAIGPDREVGTESSERVTAVSERRRVADVKCRVFTHSAKPQ